MEINTKQTAVGMVSLVAEWAQVNPELFAELVAAHKHHADVCWNLGTSAQVESIANKHRLCRKIEEQMSDYAAKGLVSIMGRFYGLQADFTKQKDSGKIYMTTRSETN